MATPPRPKLLELGRMNNHTAKSLRRGLRRKNIRGAVALEYILIAALIALGTVAAFAYLREQVSEAVAMVATHASDSAIQNGYARQSDVPAE